ncbi:alpha-glucosidase [Quadrisphaera sp. DSM 44207]|uniref:glycoside hydrolase family 13 protein n=1 Tax=Quadrisphaera sp. DSM 44207 TaxID=1881057 RepID=UPI00088BEC02|nr:alpha-glucosidase [Quadrisphaera sp. DSM 44207]SDQ03954.1 oligo-1,6-glucosidase [Quadrisphaera sp. DSM 44207]
MVSSAAAGPANEHWRRWVVYQVYPRSFADSDGDGVGDLPGILAHLDHLQRLGVDVVWLSPIYRSPMDDNGYDISDYQDVDPLFGTLADFDELLAAAHARGIRVVMDLVVNHTSDEHPWFVESRSSPENPKRDWYWWRDPRPGHAPGTPGAEPTNWESHFAGPAWEWDEASGQYYLHLFTRKQPDLNWENPQVRQAVYAMMRWWLDRGVDGFRMDVINMISKDVAPDGSLPDATPRPGSLYGPADEHTYCGPRNHEFLQEMHAEVFAGRDAHVLTVGETPGVTVAEAVLFTDPERRELDMVFQFEHVTLDIGDHRYDLRPLSLPALKGSMAAWQHGLAERGWNSLYLGNHDQPRAVSRFGDDSPEHRAASAKTLATVLHLHRGTPYVYQGDELGMRNAPFTEIGHYRDVWALNVHAEASLRGEADLAALVEALGRAGRDHARTPVQWDASPGAGFTTGTPWIDVNPDAAEVNAAAQVDDPDSVFAHHRRLIDLRHSDPVVTEGDFELLLPEHPSVWAFVRRGSDADLLVAANLSSQDVPVDLPLDGDWTAAAPVVAVLPQPPSAPSAGLVLRPWESVVWRRAR